MSKKIVAFIGLGVMGYPMAGHLAAAGYQTRVYNRTAEKAEKWCRQHGGESALTPREAAQDADFVFMCVGNDDDLRSVVFGDDGALAGCKQGSILIDHTTASANVAREIAEQSHVPFLDAPVSGGQAGAENGVLTVMIGGDPAAFEAARPVIMSYARAAELLGDVGAGQLTKMVIKSVLPAWFRACRKVWTLRSARVSMVTRWLKLFPREQPVPGKWKIAVKACSTTSLILVLRSTGCVRISQYAWRKPNQTAPSCRLPVSLTVIMAKFSKWAEAVGIHRA